MDKNEFIISTALRLFVENGFHGTATSKIAQESNVSNGTLFNYFPTKEILIVSIYNSITSKKEAFIIDNIQSHSVSKESFRSLFEVLILWNIENGIEFKYVEQFNNSPYSKLPYVCVLNEEEHPLYVLIQNGINLVVIKSLPEALLFSFFKAQINGLYSYIISNSIAKDKQSKIIEECFELLWLAIVD